MKAPTRDDWLKALTDEGLHHESDDGALTVAEFSALMGMKRNTAYGQLEALVHSGKATRVRKRGLTSTYGRTVFHVAYRLEPSAKRAAKR